jgi:hypothetical protein
MAVEGCSCLVYIISMEKYFDEIHYFNDCV